MAVFPLTGQFIEMHARISLEERARVAIAAHVEVRDVLRRSRELQGHGLDDVLIGSYARRVSIWPGKDVDVFGRLMSETVDSFEPDEAYEMFGRALQVFADQGRLTPQARSYKIDYRPDTYPSASAFRTAAQEYQWSTQQMERAIEASRRLDFEFSVDVVPAVKDGEHYGIPETGRHQRTGARYRTGGWRRTSPVKLTELTQELNDDLTVGGIGAYVRTVKTLKQVKSHYLPDAKPGFLFYEFLLHEGVDDGDIFGESWADVTASGLRYIATRLGAIGSRPARDPSLLTPYEPAPSTADIARAAAVFDDLATRADRALSIKQICEAAAAWRAILGDNEKHGPVFALPPGCKETGALMGAAAANVATGGTQERSFGGH